MGRAPEVEVPGRTQCVLLILRDPAILLFKRTVKVYASSSNSEDNKFSLMPTRNVRVMIFNCLYKVLTQY